MRTVRVSGLDLVIHEREDWYRGSKPFSGPSPLPELVHHAVIHWPGASANWRPPSDVAAHLRWANDSYLLDPNRGYFYGYGFVIGPNPIDWKARPVKTDIWEVRGYDIRIASNDGDIGAFGQMSNPNFNGRSISCQIMASEAFPATDDQILQARYFVAMSDAIYGETLTVIPHRTSDATSCPGNYITSKTATIAVRPGTVPTPPPDPTPTPTPTPGGNVLLYKVVAGDSYWKICEKVFIDGKATMDRANMIKAANPENATLNPGDLINIPGRIAV